MKLFMTINALIYLLNLIICSVPEWTLANSGIELLTSDNNYKYDYLVAHRVMYNIDIKLYRKRL